jgi:hypothetical protein
VAGYTKADYDALYRIRVSRYFGGVQAGQESIWLNYHKYGIKPILEARWAKVAPLLNIASDELVAIVGAGFGWGVEAFIAETGCTTVGIDISDYIAAEKDNTEEAEIRAAIIAAGHDPDSGHGAAVLAGVYDGQPRSNVIVLQEDMSTNQSRGNIRAALGGWPSVVIFEDLIDDTTTDQEITQANNAANLFAGAQRVIWIARPTPTRSLQDLQTLTGSEVISPDGNAYLGGP